MTAIEKTRYPILAAALAAVVAAAAFAADEKPKIEVAAADDAPRAQRMGAPAEPHAALAERAGTWRVKARIYAGDGELENNGIMVCENLLDRRFLQCTFKSTFQGFPFLGHSIDGYDRERDEYVSLWMDNTTTQVVEYRGTTDDGGKTVTFFADVIDPETGEPVQIKAIQKIQSSVQTTFEEFRRSSDDEEWTLAMRVIQSR